MSDLIYVKLEIEKCVVGPEDRALVEEVQQFKRAMEGFVIGVRKSLESTASFGDLCKNVAYHLYKILMGSDAKAEKPSWAVVIDDAARENLNSLQQLVDMDQRFWDLAFEIHRGYLGGIEAESLRLYQLHKQHDGVRPTIGSSLSEDKPVEPEYRKIIREFTVPRKINF